MLTTIQNLLNRGLPRSPRARALCAQLSSRTLALEARDIARLRLSSNGLTLALERSDAAADATCSGGALGLLGLLSPSRQAILQRGEVSVSGDTEVAEQFSELLSLLRPDIEEEVSLLTGDVPAHQLGLLVRGGVEFGRRAARTGLRNVAEYLAHERGDLVPRSEGEQFLRGVDAVREDVDRLQARLALLEQRRGPV